MTTLHHFAIQDGENPYAALTQAADDSFFGTTFYGGIFGYGTIFKMTVHGGFTTLHNFDVIEGAYPYGGLIQAIDGYFYGTTTSGGLYGQGTIFKLNDQGRVAALYNFCSQSSCTDGADSTATLLQDTDGDFYATTRYGGSLDTCNGSPCGTVFRLSTGLGSFVAMLPSYGAVGAAVTVLGTNLTGASSVTFNGTPATFTVESATAVKTTVPAGATTGPVQVVTPSGTLTSNVNFQVLP